MRLASALILLPILAAAPALAQAKPKPKPKAPAKKAGPDRPSQMPGSAPFIVVNGEVIPVSTYIDRMSVAFAPQIREAMIEETLIRQEAKKRGIKATTAEIDALVSKVYGQTLQRYGGEENLTKELKASRLWTISDYKAVIREQAVPQVLKDKLAESLVAGSEVKDTEIQERYDNNRKQFEIPETIKISHILIRRPGSSDPTKDAAARTKAEAILKRATASGADFEKLAQEVSEDTATGARGGKVPTELVRGAHPFGDAFEATVFNAETGLVRQVVPTPMGFHIIRLDSKKAGRLLPLAEVKEQIRQSLLAERRQRAMEELFVQLRTKAEIGVGRF